MLSKKHKLPIQSFIRKRSDVKSSQHFRLKSFSYERADSPQFGVVVSSRVSKKAVERNRIKRQIFQYCSDNISAIRPGKYIIVADRNANTISRNDITRELDTLFYT